MPQRERYLVTSGLPYANGPLHFGHLVGAYLPADVFVRYQRMAGHDVAFICGTDEHGVAITLQAESEGKSYAAFVDHWHEVIAETFRRFRIEFDVFSRTTRADHYDLSQRFFRELLDNGHIVEKTEEQLYCPRDRKFLADRYVVGTCPYCGAEGARGDECGRCGRWLEAGRIRDARCKICGATPEMRATRNWYLRLQDFQPRLEEWLASREGWKENVLGAVKQVLHEGLRERAITRDLPWGVPVPLPDTEGKVLYVWFEAPIGYVSATREWARAKGDPELWKRYWCDPATKVVHFIGKDNIPFHCLIFPAMILGQTTRYTLPWNVPANEFYNLEGRKFSTSERWTIDLERATADYPIDLLRYALVASMPETADSEFTWRDFYARSNHELADILGNLATRVVLFAERHFGGTVPAATRIGTRDEAMLAERGEAARRFGEAVSGFQLRRAATELMGLARAGNKYFDEKQPWATRKTDREECATTIHVSLQVLRSLAYLMSPIVPDAAERLWAMLGEEGPVQGRAWDEAGRGTLPEGRRVGPGKPLFPKLERERMEAEVAELHARSQGTGSEQPETTDAPAVTRPGQPGVAEGSVGATKEPPATAADAPAHAASGKTEIAYDDFVKLDLRVGRVLACEKVPKADRLLRLVVDLGTEQRQVVAGIAESYPADSLIGTDVVVLVNLKPRKLRGLESKGMILAATDASGRVRVLRPEAGSEPGSTVK